MIKEREGRGRERREGLGEERTMDYNAVFTSLKGSMAAPWSKLLIKNII